MLMRSLLRNCFRFSKFKLDNYVPEDYETMCGLLREKYQLHNEQVQSSGLIKLLDDAGRVIGVYTASEARKKTANLNLDMVLVNRNSSPILCKAVDFRQRVINRFFEEVVAKSQKMSQSRAGSVKSVKISAGLGRSHMVVKVKQINELAQKHAKVRVFMGAKVSQREECLAVLEDIKSQLLNRCYIEEEISNRRFEEDQPEEGKTDRRTENYSFVVRARQVDLAKKMSEEKKHDPQTSVRNFLKKYYSQDDGEMMDLKSAGLFEVESGVIEEEKKKELQLDQAEMLKIKRQQDWERKRQVDPIILREAEARVLNQRLKILLSFTV